MINMAWDRYVILQNTSGVPLQTDEGGILATLGHNEFAMHEGSLYVLFDYLTLSSGGTSSFAVEVPADGEYHLSFQAEGSDGITIDVFRDVLYTGGTPITASNANENEACSPGLTTMAGVVVTDFGTRLGGYKVGANKLAGAVEESDGRILRNSATYSYLFTSAGADNIITYKAKWSKE